LSEVRLNVHSETHRFALGSQILIDCLLLDVIHKYRYSNYLDYNAYHTWLQELIIVFIIKSTVPNLREGLYSHSKRSLYIVYEYCYIQVQAIPHD